MTPEEQVLENQKKNTELVHAYKRLFSGNDSKLVLADLENICGFRRPSFDNQWNTNRVFCHEGMRNVYLHILSKLERETND